TKDIAEETGGSIQQDFEVLIYPNPTTGRVTVELPYGDSSSTSLAVYDMIGNRLYQSEVIQTNQSSLDLSQYPSGIYFIKVITEKGTVIKKVIRN
ncbi:MAG: T9SS type A sorting domain-containing protein, partial [Flavobacteriaceae bacterium]|nr:T9SS type A sorting domain-containing protein [Flavobacteriaceae bacterium]